MSGVVHQAPVCSTSENVSNMESGSPEEKLYPEATLHRIKEVIPWFKSTYQLRMDDKKQTEIPVSRVQTKRLRELLKL